MKINSIELKNFRNHKDLKIDFNDPTVVLTGPNGAGKTNILEAIYLLSTAKSPRTRYDADLITHNEEFTTILGTISTNTDKYILDLQIKRLNPESYRSSKKAKVNKVARRINTFTGIFNSVLFTPEDIHLLTRSPSYRRRYLDNTLSQIDNKYKSFSSDYAKAVRQRNKLLEEMMNFPALSKQLDYWTSLVLNKGLYIQNTRSEYLNKLENSLQQNKQLYSENHVDIKIKYEKSELTENRLKEYRKKEIYAGRSLIGPHRDDFKIEIDGFDIAEFGSRGQQRSTVLGLKMAELEYIEIKMGERPVLLLDDIFSELDEDHQKTVLDMIGQQQNIITTAEKHTFLKQYPILAL